MIFGTGFWNMREYHSTLLLTNKEIMQLICWNYIRRAMPYTAPGSLSADDTYAVTAYILSLNGIVSADAKLNQDLLPKVTMPNRDGFIPDQVFKLDNEPEAPPNRGSAP